MQEEKESFLPPPVPILLSLFCVFTSSIWLRLEFALCAPVRGT